MVPYLYTHSDVVSHMSDWAGFTSAVTADMLRKIKRSVDNAYRALTHLRAWTIYTYRGRLNAAASYNTGTIAYTNSTRTVTITGGTLPANTNLCMFRVGAVDYPIVNGSANIGAGTFQLSVNSNPGADLAAGTSYTLYQDTYVLPINFRSMGTVRDANRSRILQYVEPNEFVASRQIFQAPTNPFWYTLRGDPSYLGMQALSFYPPPNDTYQYDYMGQRYPRPFTTPVPYTTGTVSTSGTVLTGTGFNSNMVGCIVRFSTSTTAPTSNYGTNPYYQQRVITSYTNTTTMGMDQALSADQAGVAFEISDPIDMEAGAMYTAFLRLCELELGQLLNRDDIDRLTNQYRMAERLALEADTKSTDSKPGGTRYWQRVSDYQALTDSTS